MRTYLVSAALAALMVTSAASAEPLLEPAASFRYAFGGSAAKQWSVGVRLDYSRSIRDGLADRMLSPRDRADLKAFGAFLPAALEWSVGGDGRHSLLSNGLTLGAGSLRLNQAEDTQDGGGSFWGGNVGLALLGTGAALALVVVAAGDAAEDNNPVVNTPGDTPSPGGDETCIQVGPSDACANLDPGG